MAIKKSELYSSLWKSCDELRGGMDASQYKDYVLILLFIKYVSDKYAGDPNALIDVPAGGGFADMVAAKGDKEIGDRVNKIIGKLADADDSLKGAINVADFNDEESCVTVDDVILGGDILVIRTDKRRMCGTFLSYVIRREDNQVLQLVTGSTVFHLYGSDMKKFAFSMPPHSEQTAIATVLSDMDAELAAREARRDKTRALKQGMMQELLTGRIIPNARA